MDEVDVHTDELDVDLARGDYANGRLLAEGLGLRIDEHED